MRWGSTPPAPTPVAQPPAGGQAQDEQLPAQARRPSPLAAADQAARLGRGGRGRHRPRTLTCLGRGRSGARRVGVVLGLDGGHGGGVEPAASRKRLGQALKVPLKAGGGVQLHEPRHAAAWVGKGVRDPPGDEGEAAGPLRGPKRPPSPYRGPLGVASLGQSRRPGPTRARCRCLGRWHPQGRTGQHNGIGASLALAPALAKEQGSRWLVLTGQMRRATRVPHRTVNHGPLRATMVAGSPPISWSPKDDQRQCIPRMCLIRKRSRLLLPGRAASHYSSRSPASSRSQWTVAEVI